MNKQQAADYLGVSVRALERYVQQGKISVKYEKGKTRSTANFEETELELFKEQLNQPIVKPAIDSRQISTEEEQEQGKIVHHSGEVNEVGEITVIDKLSSIIEGLLGEKQPLVAVGEKLLLTVVEVHQLTGLSREFLKDAIAAGQQIGFGSLYPTLNRLEKKGLISWKWGDEKDQTGGARRKYYEVTGLGATALREVEEYRQLLAGWSQDGLPIPQGA